jgi:oxygen-independent coproporphyrinogen III oxidase
MEIGKGIGDMMKMNNQTNSLYLHVPVCKHLCNFCDFYKVKLTERQLEFDQFESNLQAALPRVIDLHHQHYSPIGELATIYLGGGTPSLWSLRGADFFANHILTQFKVNANLEFSYEVDPSAWDEAGIKAWRQLGANRFSLGIQSTQDHILQLIDRGHGRREVFQLLEFMALQNVNFSCDFMLGLPAKGEARKIEHELQEILQFNPKHISLYIYSVGEKHPLFDFIIDDEQVAREFELVHSILTEHGFTHYEVSNYGKEGFESRHNWKYWRHENVLALGPSASGFIQTEQGAIRYKWQTQQAVFNLEPLDQEQLKLEQSYTLLRTRQGLEYKKFFRASSELDALLVFWQKQGWVTIDQGQLYLTPSSMVVMDSLHNMLLNFL